MPVAFSCVDRPVCGSDDPPLINALFPGALDEKCHRHARKVMLGARHEQQPIDRVVLDAPRWKHAVDAAKREGLDCPAQARLRITVQPRHTGREPGLPVRLRSAVVNLGNCASSDHLRQLGA